MLKVLFVIFMFFQGTTASITAPQTGETLRGLIDVQGQMDEPNFASAELAFTFDANAADPAASWFPIQTYSQPTAGPVLAAWDTTAVTDGEYALRLKVTLQDGTTQETLVRGLKVRNEEPLPTITPTATEVNFNFQPVNETLGVSAQSTSTPIIAYPTSTPLPANPASLTTSAIFTIFWQSALVVLILFAFFSLILRLRKNT